MEPGPAPGSCSCVLPGSCVLERNPFQFPVSTAHWVGTGVRAVRGFMGGDVSRVCACPERGAKSGPERGGPEAPDSLPARGPLRGARGGRAARKFWGFTFRLADPEMRFSKREKKGG